MTWIVRDSAGLYGHHLRIGCRIDCIYRKKASTTTRSPTSSSSTQRVQSPSRHAITCPWQRCSSRRRSPNCSTMTSASPAG